MERFKFLEDKDIDKKPIFINDNVVVCPATSVPGLYTIKPSLDKRSILELSDIEFVSLSFMQRQLRIELRNLFDIKLCGLYFEEHPNRKVTSYTIPFHIDRLKERFSVDPYQPYIYEYIDSYESNTIADKVEIFNHKMTEVLMNTDIKRILGQMTKDLGIAQPNNLINANIKESPRIEKILEVLDERDLPDAPAGKKYFVCIGGNKNFQCFLADSSLSKGEFLFAHENDLDDCLRPIYDDGQIVVRQDAKYAIPGFYIVSTRETYRTVDEMPLSLFMRCMILTRKIKSGLLDLNVSQTHMYNDEKLNSPASVHFWVLPIHKRYAEDHNLTIYSSDIWKYLDSYPRFVYTKQNIFKINEKMKSYLKNSVNFNELTDIGI